MSTNSFSQMKKNRNSQLQKLTEEAKKLESNNQQSRSDDRYWKPTVDKSGNGSAIIRFLPAPQNEDMPFVRYWDHGFQGPGGWYIEKSLTTIGKEDPVSQLNSKLWNTGLDSDKEIARKRKRRLHYVSNIYVISDPGNPENDGKVFLYEYGKKIFEKINALMHPEFDDEEAVNPFDLWEGANFRLRIRNYEGYRNYDKSTFDSPTALLDDDEDLERVWTSQHSLQDLIAESQFKTYAELQSRLQRVLGDVATNTTAEDDMPEESPWSPPTVQSAQQKSRQAKPQAEEVNFDDDDDSLNFFKALAED